MSTTIPWDSPSAVTPNPVHLSPPETDHSEQPLLETIMTSIFGAQANNVLIILEEIGFEDLDNTAHLNETDLKREVYVSCPLYTSPSPRDQRGSRMPSSA